MYLLTNAVPTPGSDRPLNVAYKIICDGPGGTRPNNGLLSGMPVPFRHVVTY